MIEASGAGVAIQASRLPFLPGAQALAAAGHFSGGMLRNRRHVETVLGERLSIHESIGGPLAGLLFEAETSGGLLFSVAADRVTDVARGAKERGEEFAEIGEVIPERAIRITP
jgi:selenide,water dikinase